MSSPSPSSSSPHVGAMAVFSWRRTFITVLLFIFSVKVLLYLFQAAAPPFPVIKSSHSLVAKHVTPEKWKKLGGLKTKTSGFTLGQVRFTLQH